jgi:hypothetical protein
MIRELGERGHRRNRAEHGGGQGIHRDGLEWLTASTPVRGLSRGGPEGRRAGRPADFAR